MSVAKILIRVFLVSVIAMLSPGAAVGQSPAASPEPAPDLERAFALVDFSCYLAKSDNEFRGKEIPLEHLNPLEESDPFTVQIDSVEQFCSPVAKANEGDPGTFEEARSNAVIAETLAHIDYVRYSVNADAPALPVTRFVIDHLNPLLAATPPAQITTLRLSALLLPVVKDEDPPTSDLFQQLSIVGYACYAVDTDLGITNYFDLLNLNPAVAGQVDKQVFVGRLVQACLPVIIGGKMSAKDAHQDPNLAVVSDVDRTSYLTDYGTGAVTGQHRITYVDPIFGGASSEVSTGRITEFQTPVRKRPAEC